MIKATGIRGGKPLEVVYTNEHGVLFNGEYDELLLFGLDFELSMCHAVGGTYFPKRDSTLNILNTLQNYYFDYNADVWTDEEIEEIPSVKEVIY